VIAATMSREVRRTYVPPSPRRFDKVTIWRKGNIVSSGGLARLYIYPSSMKRILVRPFGFDACTGKMRYSCSFYWESGAWSSVCFDGLDELTDVVTSVAAKLLRWPEVEQI